MNFLVRYFISSTFFISRNLFLLDVVLLRATADFNEKGVGVQAKRINGVINGKSNYIFHWVDGLSRKMVLASNFGQILKDGEMDESEDSWMDSENWSESGKGKYSITNFQGRQGIRIC